MIVVHLVGGPKCGQTITTSDRHPKDLWRFDQCCCHSKSRFDECLCEEAYKVHIYVTMMVRDKGGQLWWLARHESMSEQDALDTFLEKHYVPKQLRRTSQRMARRPNGTTE